MKEYVATMGATELMALRQELFFTTWDMHRVLRDVANPICQQHGVTLQQMHILAELSRNPGLTAGILSDRTGILRTNFAAVCRKLENKGLVERRRKEGDKRAYQIRVTPEGRALLRDIEEEMRKRFEYALKEESPETFNEVLSGLSAVSGLVQKLDQNLDPNHRFEIVGQS